MCVCVLAMANAYMLGPLDLDHKTDEKHFYGYLSGFEKMVITEITTVSYCIMNMCDRRTRGE